MKPEGRFLEQVATMERHIRRYIPQQGYDTVLEIGCGEGGGLLPWIWKGCDCVGVDLSHSRILAARSYLGDAATLICGDAAVIQGKYDLIIARDVIEHVPNHWRLIHNMKSLLADGGVIFVSFPPWYGPYGVHQLLRPV